MIWALLFAAAAPQTAIEAELAFAAAAERDGQWTAFRRYAAPSAIMFVPKSANAQMWLKNRKDPARSVRWQPIASYISCDGTVSVNTGAWQQPNGSVGYFTTVWQKQPDGSWRWLLDSGDRLNEPRAVPKKPIVWRAACTPARWPMSVVVDPNERGGDSPDHSLRWRYKSAADGSRYVGVALWTGTISLWVIDDHIAQPTP